VVAAAHAATARLYFRRQAPFRSYILDFVEHDRKIVIELDGGQHAEPENKRKDEIRDRILTREGYLVLRFDNGGVLSDMEGTVDYILRMIEQRPPTRIAARSGLPTRGR
jgi:very-short-patch-repair endonuclease